MPVSNSETSLAFAADDGDYDLAKGLINRGANIEEVNEEGYTPLMLAARKGHEELVSLLLFNGADIDSLSVKTQETALCLACCGGYIETADFLVKSGANVNLGANTPVMLAAREGHIEIVRYLLSYDCNVNATNADGDTALSYARANGHNAVAALLSEGIGVGNQNRRRARAVRGGGAIRFQNLM